MNAAANPMVAGLGTTEILIILGILILLFGAKKLPELARGSGRALRIFKAETKGLIDEDENDKHKTPEQRQLDAGQRTGTSTTDSTAEPHPSSSDTER
jgi:sec-independent protein translocase protein TatA